MAERKKNRRRKPQAAPKTVNQELLRDALQPTAKRLGTDLKPAGTELAKAGMTLAKSVNVALAPLSLLVWGYDKIKDVVIPAIAEKLQARATAKLVTPNPAVAGPAVETLRFVASQPKLREMFVNLLASSMDAETAQQAHPAFVEIIRQLTVPEAQIMEYFASARTSPQVTTATPVPQSPQMEFLYPAITLLHLDTDCDPLLIPSYRDNLHRLGLISPGYFRQAFLFNADPSVQRILDSEWIAEFSRIAKEKQGRFELHAGYFGLTSFGSQFCQICVLGEKGEGKASSDEPLADNEGTLP